jgi:hypothetical protein
MLLRVNVTLIIKNPLDKIFGSIPALNPAERGTRFRACWIIGCHPRLSEKV